MTRDVRERPATQLMGEDFNVTCLDFGYQVSVQRNCLATSRLFFNSFIVIFNKIFQKWRMYDKEHSFHHSNTTQIMHKTFKYCPKH